MNTQERTVRVVMTNGCVYYMTPEEGALVTTAAGQARRSAVLLNIPRRVLGSDAEDVVPQLTLFTAAIASVES